MPLLSLTFSGLKGRKISPEERIKNLELSTKTLEELFQEEVDKGRLEALPPNASKTEFLKLDKDSVAIQNAIMGLKLFLEKAGTPASDQEHLGHDFWRKLFRPRARALVSQSEISEAEGMRRRADRLLKLSQRREAYLDLRKIFNDFELPCPAGFTEKKYFNGPHYDNMSRPYCAFAEETFRLRDHQVFKSPRNKIADVLNEIAEHLHGIVIHVGENMYRRPGDCRCYYVIMVAGGAIYETWTAIQDFEAFSSADRESLETSVNKIKLVISEAKALLEEIKKEQEEEDEIKQRKEQQEQSFLQRCGITDDDCLNYSKVVEILVDTQGPRLGLHIFKNLKSRGRHGSGGNSVVFQAIDGDSPANLSTGGVLSVKVHNIRYSQAENQKNHCKRIVREAYYWTLALRGVGEWKNRIAPLLGVCIGFNGNGIHGDQNGIPSLVTTFRVDGNLLSYSNLPEEAGPNEAERRRLVSKAVPVIARQFVPQSHFAHNQTHMHPIQTIEVAQGLAYLHGLEDEIVHGDLKSENVLVCRNPNNSTYIQIIDFGSARQKQGLSGATTGTRPTTMIYEAPEVSYPGSVLTTRSDMYAYAFVLLEVIYGVQTDVAFMNTSWSDKCKRLPQGMRQTDKDLVEKLWDLHPQRRPDARNVVKELQNGP